MQASFASVSYRFVYTGVAPLLYSTVSAQV